jgi:hypothetical protein
VPRVPGVGEGVAEAEDAIVAVVTVDVRGGGGVEERHGHEEA